MNVYVIRHGQSEANVRHEYCGWTHVPLSPKGLDDARRAGELLKDIHFDKVYASDLMRAMQTCETALPGIPYEKTPLLRELDTGTLEGLNVEKAFTIYGEPLEIAYKTSDFTPWQGENRQMELDRTLDFMRMLEESDHENVAVFCHAGTVCCLLQLTLGAAFTYNHLAVDNGSVSVFFFHNGLWQLKKWNMT